MIAFTKPALSTDQQLDQWQARGLLIPDVSRARHYLERISYYRLSAYAIPYYLGTSTDHQFRKGTTFDNILGLYIFDRELRLLVMDAIERVEVAVRTRITNHMSTQGDENPFWYLDKHAFKTSFPLAKLLSDLEMQLKEEQERLRRDEQQVEKRKHLTAAQKEQIKTRLRKENFLRHYLTHYDHPRLPPSWMMMEMLTWGQLSRIYNGLRKTSDQKAIAESLGTHAELLEAWLKTLNTVRNICAHHSRLWNRELGTALRLPTSKRIRWLEKAVVLDAGHRHINYQKRLYPVLVALQSLLYNISPGSRWAHRLSELVEKHPDADLAAMGMPEKWHDDPFWAAAMEDKERV